MSWLTAEQALNLLGTKSQTLYANVSRGRIRAKADPADTRRSLYFADDVKRLATRHAGRRKTETVAAEAIQWGDPVLPSALSTVSNGRLFYRGKDVAMLAESVSLEDIARLLWDMKRPLRFDPSEAWRKPPSLDSALSALAERITSDLPSLGVRFRHCKMKPKACLVRWLRPWPRARGINRCISASRLPGTAPMPPI